jgi:putative transposase
MADTGIAALQLCFATRAGRSMTNVWNAYGVVRVKVPCKQPKRGRLWLNDGSSVRLRAEYVNQVWSYDFIHHRTDDGRVFRTLNVLDEHSRECLAIRIKRKLNSIDVIDVLTDLFILRGVAGYIRSDNGPEFIAVAVRDWIAAVGPRRLTSNPDHPGRTDMLRASMPVFETSY